jgi:hypothetical protein
VFRLLGDVAGSLGGSKASAQLAENDAAPQTDLASPPIYSPAFPFVDHLERLPEQNLVFANSHYGQKNP